MITSNANRCVRARMQDADAGARRGAEGDLIPQAHARGLTWFMPGEDPTLVSKQQIFARIVGGRAAEDVIFGEPDVTTGAAGDLQQVTHVGCVLARYSRKMTWKATRSW